MSSPSIESVDGRALSHGDFPHLSSFEWEALRRLAETSGIAVAAAVLAGTPDAQQRTAIQEFVTRELADLRRRAATPAQPKADVVKLDVSTYTGEGPHRLALNRWLCEVDIAIEARKLASEQSRTHFLLSKLGGRAKEWALGRLVADSTCFPTLDSLKDDLRLAFEPPQDENQHRAAFLSLRQGRSSMLDYIQRTRHLASCVVENPIDTVTQVHVFVAGMNPGHQRFYLTRKPPATLEEAFAIALREDYSVKASRHHAPESRVEDEPVPMEIDALEHAAPASRGGFGPDRAPRTRATTSKQLTCYRCRKIGHRAAECRAPAPVLAAVDTSGGQRVEPASPKNAGSQ